MPITLKDLKAKTATVDVYATLGKDDMAGDLIVTYLLADAPGGKQAEAHKLMKGDDAGALLDFGADVIAHRLVSWDLLGDDGKPLPITAKVIRDEIPQSVITDIARAIALNNTPSKSEGAASSAS